MTPGIVYTEGGRYLAVGEAITVLSTDHDLVLRLWPVVRDGGDVAATLAAGLASGFAALADLAVLEHTGDRVEILLRGDVDVVAESSSSPTSRWDGRGARTWREFSVADPTVVTVAGGGDLDFELPLRSGVVRAAGFRWTASAIPVLPIPAAPSAPPPGAQAPTPERIPPVPEVGAAMPTSPPPPPPKKPSPATDPPHPRVSRPTPEPTAHAISAPDQVLSEIPSPPPHETPPAPPPPASPSPAVAVPEEHAAAETRIGPGDDFDHLFESTILRSPEDAAVRLDPDEEQDAAGAPSASVAGNTAEHLGDHDGSTILGGQLAALLRGAQQTAEDVPPPPPPPGSPRVELLFSTGQVVAGDQPVVIGRKPQVDRVAGNQIPRLITVTGPNNDISRSHLEIRPDGTGLLATDLGSTNGTTLVGPGGSRPLTAHIPERIEPGTRLDLGDGVTIDVRMAR